MPRGPRHHFVLIFRCADASLYTMAAPDIADAEATLRAAPNRGIRGRMPVMLAYAEEHMSAQSAKRGVVAVRRMSRAKKEQLLQSWKFPAR